MKARLTDHARDRLKERCGWRGKAAQRMADKALQCGMRHAAAEGKLKRWIDRLFLAERKASNVRLYGSHAFLFCGETLITVLHIPREMLKLVNLANPS